MKITSLELKNFRNYDYLKINFNENVNLILGNNAQGKTNLIEAIYITSMGKSFRTNKDSDMILFGNDFAKVNIHAEKSYIDTDIDITIKNDSKKSIKKDGNQIKKISELLENILIVIFSPEDLKIVKDEPEKRRKFIDRELCQINPMYYDNLNNYKKVLLQRNSYLKEEKIDNNILDLWDLQLSKYGAKVIKIREKFIKKISDISGGIHNNITNEKEILEIKYNSNINIKKNLLEQEQFIYETLKSSYKNDLKMRTTTRGPHKDDILFFVNEINMRNFGSQGQQRTTALSLKLAEISLIKEETGEDAILLLDDVMSELDIERQKYLIKSLKNIQLFITTTDIDENLKKSFPNANILYINNGKIL